MNQCNRIQIMMLCRWAKTVRIGCIDLEPSVIQLPLFRDGGRPGTLSSTSHPVHRSCRQGQAWPQH
jgi:hypothetical protein